MTRYYCTGISAEAAWRLHQCMIAQGKPVLAWLFWAACRAGGWYFWKDKTHGTD